MIDKDYLIRKCHALVIAYKEGKLGYMKMPEDENPGFTHEQQEIRLCYFTLPMALNYQRNSYTLRESVLKSYTDDTTRDLFSVQTSSSMDEELLRKKLLKHKIALQPNKHIKTRQTIATTITTHWGSISAFLDSCDYDFLCVQACVQHTYKSGFPYLSGPKIFHYRAHIIQQYGNIVLKNSEYIEIAPDTHITQSSVVLGVISLSESISMSKDALSSKWRELLSGSGITPSEMHAPLRFWSRNNFEYELSFI